MEALAATIQLCTYNRAHLLERVLQGCFEQTVANYEVVVVDDGSSDGTAAVLDRARESATVPFTVVSHANRGLAASRNVGIARARGERIIFIDDDVLPMPNFVAEHLRTARAHPADIVRGAVIMTSSFDRLPPPTYSLLNYSGNYFWTSNVSVPLATLRSVGCFDERFREYGWEDIDLGLRFRLAGVHSRFNRNAVAFHYKAAPAANRVESMLAQARAQARTAVVLQRKHGHWRVPLATGDTPLQRGLARLQRKNGVERRLAQRIHELDSDHVLTPREHRAAKALARHAYFAELDLLHSHEPTNGS